MEFPIHPGLFLLGGGLPLELLANNMNGNDGLSMQLLAHLLRRMNRGDSDDDSDDYFEDEEDDEDDEDNEYSFMRHLFRYGEDGWGFNDYDEDEDYDEDDDDNDDDDEEEKGYVHDNNDPICGYDDGYYSFGQYDNVNTIDHFSDDEYNENDETYYFKPDYQSHDIPPGVSDDEYYSDSYTDTSGSEDELDDEVEWRNELIPNKYIAPRGYTTSIPFFEGIIGTTLDSCRTMDITQWNQLDALIQPFKMTLFEELIAVDKSINGIEKCRPTTRIRHAIDLYITHYQSSSTTSSSSSTTVSKPIIKVITPETDLSEQNDIDETSRDRSRDYAVESASTESESENHFKDIKIIMNTTTLTDTDEKSTFLVSQLHYRNADRFLFYVPSATSSADEMLSTIKYYDFLSILYFIDPYEFITVFFPTIPLLKEHELQLLQNHIILILLYKASLSLTMKYTTDEANRLNIIDWSKWLPYLSPEQIETLLSLTYNNGMRIIEVLYYLFQPNEFYSIAKHLPPFRHFTQLTPLIKAEIIQPIQLPPRPIFDDDKDDEDDYDEDDDQDDRDEDDQDEDDQSDEINQRDQIEVNQDDEDDDNNNQDDVEKLTTTKDNDSISTSTTKDDDDSDEDNTDEDNTDEDNTDEDSDTEDQMAFPFEFQSQPQSLFDTFTTKPYYNPLIIEPMVIDIINTSYQYMIIEQRQQYELDIIPQDVKYFSRTIHYKEYPTEYQIAPFEAFIIHNQHLYDKYLRFYATQFDTFLFRTPIQALCTYSYESFCNTNYIKGTKIFTENQLEQHLPLQLDININNELTSITTIPSTTTTATTLITPPSTTTSWIEHLIIFHKLLILISNTPSFFTYGNSHLNRLSDSSDTLNMYHQYDYNSWCQSRFIGFIINYLLAYSGNEELTIVKSHLPTKDTKLLKYNSIPIYPDATILFEPRTPGFVNPHKIPFLSPIQFTYYLLCQPSIFQSHPINTIAIVMGQTIDEIKEFYIHLLMQFDHVYNDINSLTKYNTKVIDRFVHIQESSHTDRQLYINNEQSKFNFTPMNLEFATTLRILRLSLEDNNNNNESQ